MQRLASNCNLLSTPWRAASHQLCKQQNYHNQYKHHHNNNRSEDVPPPHFQEAGFGKFVLFLAPLIAAGGTIAYSKRDPEFRKIVEQNVPGADRILKVALQEEPAFPSIAKRLDEAKDSISKMTSTATNLFGFKSDEKAAKSKDEDLPFMKSTPPPTNISKPSPPIPSAEKKEKSAAKVPEPTKTISKPAVVATPVPVKPQVTLPSNIVDLEKEVEVSASLAVKEYSKAIEILKNFNADVSKVVDQAIDNADVYSWNSLKNKTSARDSAVNTAETLAQDAIKKIEQCEIALSKIVDSTNQEKVLQIRNKIKNFEDHIIKSKDELYKNKDLAAISEKYWRNVEKARNYFVEEIEALFHGLNLSEKQLKLSNEDLDLFIVHAYSHILTLKKELQRMQTEGEVRLKRALEAIGSDNDATKAQINYLVEEEKRRLHLENQKKIFQIRAESTKELRDALRKQSEAHVDHLRDALQLKEAELKRNYNRELEAKLANERANYKLQLAAMLGKLRGMDAALQVRAESERSAHQAQALWAACQSLWSVVRTGEPGVDWHEKLKPLKNEIQAISKVAEGDELVSVVLQNMPKEARERGVYPEDALRERFFNVERIARKLALVPEEGASIPMYILSYLQSLFIMRPEEPISKEELHNQPFDFSKLDTYDILNRARYFIDHGDLLQALKYMNLLKGASRKVSSDWLKETRLLLETQQAANTLMAHAAASGLLYL